MEAHEMTMKPRRISFTMLYNFDLRPGKIVNFSCGSFSKPKNEDWIIDSIKHVRDIYELDTTEVSCIIVTVTRWQRAKRWLRGKWGAFKYWLGGLLNRRT